MIWVRSKKLLAGEAPTIWATSQKLLAGEAPTERALVDENIYARKNEAAKIEYKGTVTVTRKRS